MTHNMAAKRPTSARITPLDIYKVTWRHSHQVVTSPSVIQLLYWCVRTGRQVITRSQRTEASSCLHLLELKVLKSCDGWS